MVKSIKSGPRSEASHPQNAMIELYEFFLDGEMHCWTTNNQDIAYEGKTYRAWSGNLQRTKISSDLDGTLGDLTVKAANVDGVLGQQILERDLSGAFFTLRKAFLNHLETGEAWVVFEGTVDELEIDKNLVYIKIRSFSTGLHRLLPRRTYSVYCPWNFKGAECGYSGALTACKKSLSECSTRSNVERFGGFDCYVTPA